MSASSTASPSSRPAGRLQRPTPTGASPQHRQKRHRRRSATAQRRQSHRRLQLLPVRRAASPRPHRTPVAPRHGGRRHRPPAAVPRRPRLHRSYRRPRARDSSSLSRAPTSSATAITSPWSTPPSAPSNSSCSTSSTSPATPTAPPQASENRPESLTSRAERWHQCQLADPFRASVFYGIQPGRRRRQRIGGRQVTVHSDRSEPVQVLTAVAPATRIAKTASPIPINDHGKMTRRPMRPPPRPAVVALSRAARSRSDSEGR